MIGIYKITNKVNGKFYIGSSKDINFRIRRHFNSLKSCTHPNKHLQSAFNKYGKENFIVEILELCSIENIITREQYYLDSNNWNNMYNKTRQAYGGGSDVTCKEFVLLDLEGNVVDRFYSGRDMKRFFNLKSASIDYSHVNTNSKFLYNYRVVSLDFFTYNKDIIYPWKNYDEL